MSRQISASAIQVSQGKRKFLLTVLPAGVLTTISYVAVRGLDSEQGAIQRVLNPRRIASIKDFTLAGGDYPNAIILNWVSKVNPLVRKKDVLHLRDVADSAQIIDGQHRVEGLKAAIVENPQLSKLSMPVVIYEGLTTQECADIFLSINTEQKPVARSLVFDLYGEASEHIIDPAALRARDIAIYLNDADESPYQGNIKLPGAPTRKSGIALSTVVSAIKPLVEEKGIFEQIDVRELEMQRRIILNLFVALKEKYGGAWSDKENVFMYAAGFIGALDFLKLKLIPYCNTQRSFTASTISDALVLVSSTLVLQEEVKGLGGKDAPKRVYDRLVAAFRTKGAISKSLEI